MDNTGVWECVTELVGSDTRTLGSTVDFGARVEPGADFAGEVVAVTSIRFTDFFIDFGDGQLTLPPGSSMILEQARFSGTLDAAGNDVIFETFSYFNDATVIDPVLHGTIAVGHQVRFEGTTVVMDLLQNNQTSGGSFLVVDGDLIVHGDISRPHYSFVISLDGSLELNGTAELSSFQIVTPGPHELRMGENALLNAPILLAEFSPVSVVATTDLRLGAAISLGIDGSLTLAPASTVTFESGGGLSGGTITANGSMLVGDGFIGSTQIQDVTIDGAIYTAGESTFAGGLDLTGSLVGFSGNSAEVTIEGDFVNDAAIFQEHAPFSLIATGDLMNRGTIQISEVIIRGTEDQTVEIGSGISAIAFIMESDVLGSSYQWLRDGVALAGQTNPALILPGVSTADLGEYRCEVDGTVVSRVIAIGQGVVSVPTSGLGGSVVLSAARPNPLRTGTSFTLSLNDRAETRVAVYDVAGREIAVLAEGSLSAGRHDFTWNAASAAPGVYFLQGQAGTTRVSQRLVRVGSR